MAIIGDLLSPVALLRSGPAGRQTASSSPITPTPADPGTCIPCRRRPALRNRSPTGPGSTGSQRGNRLRASAMEPKSLCAWRRSGACIARPTREGYQVVCRPRRTPRGACLAAQSVKRLGFHGNRCRPVTLRGTSVHLALLTWTSYPLLPDLLRHGLADRNGLHWTLGVLTTLVEPEGRVPVGHQGDIHQQPIAPPVDSDHQVIEARGVTRGEQHRDGRDQHTRANQAWGGIGNGATLLHARRHDITRPEECADQEILREGEQPLDQREPTVELLRVVDLQPRRVVRDIGQSERGVAV